MQEIVTGEESENTSDTTNLSDVVSRSRIYNEGVSIVDTTVEVVPIPICERGAEIVLEESDAIYFELDYVGLDADVEDRVVDEEAIAQTVSDGHLDTDIGGVIGEVDPHQDVHILGTVKPTSTFIARQPESLADESMVSTDYVFGKIQYAVVIEVLEDEIGVLDGEIFISRFQSESEAERFADSIESATNTGKLRCNHDGQTYNS